MKQLLLKLGASFFLAMILLTCFAWFLPAQVTQIGGLAVAQSGTQWNRVKDASQGDGLTNGIMAMNPYIFNGATFDRLRGDITGGLRMQGSGTPADTFTNPTNALTTFSLGGLFDATNWNRWRSDNTDASLAGGVGNVRLYIAGAGGVTQRVWSYTFTGDGSGNGNPATGSMLWNGATADRQRAISPSTLTATTSIGSNLNVPLSTWSVTSTPAVATQATASRAAGGGTVRHVATTLTVCIATGATAQTPILAHLRDGATGAGTILRSFAFAAPVNDHGCESLSGLAMIGTANTAMTIEFAAAGVAASQETVTLTGFSVP